MGKTMLDFLNEVSKEKGFESWYQVYLIGNDEMHNIIPQEAGVRYAAQQVVIFNRVPILTSEDGVKMFEGDNYHRAFFDKKWIYDYCEGLTRHHAVNRDDEFSAQAKAFSTKEYAKEWIKKQNKS